MIVHLEIVSNVVLEGKYLSYYRIMVINTETYETEKFLGSSDSMYIENFIDARLLTSN